MYKPNYQKQFEKDIKKVQKRNYDMEELKKVISNLVKGLSLDSKYKDHQLTGNFNNCRECHIKPDWLLIYTIKPEENKIIFIRTGTHSDLFKK
jgi:mRNA interferase YafQ